MFPKVGQLILTNRRLIYIKYRGMSFLGVQAISHGEDYSNRIEEGLKNKGSFEIPIGQISEAKIKQFGRHLSIPYLSVRYQNSSGEKACSFQVMAKGQDLNSLNEALAKTINRLRHEASEN